MGNLHLELPNGSKTSKVTFKNAVHSPSMAFTLLSISKLDMSGHKVTFQKQMCTIQDSKGITIAKIPHSQGLYKVLMDNKEKPGLRANAAIEKMSISKAHRKLGHISSAAIKHAVSKGFITGISLDDNSTLEFCDACAKAKSARQPFPKESETRAEKYGDHVHWDLWGPAAVKSINGNYYLAARIDDATRETKLYFQEKKSQTFDSYKKDEAFIETQTGNQIKLVRSDRGGEFLTKKFTDYQDIRGTVRQLTVHDSPSQNGVAERGMRTRAERARALLCQSGLPRFLWEEAMKHTTWLQNRTPARALNGKTPYEAINNKKPYLGGIQEFGVAAYVKDIRAGKLDARAQVGRFVGYDAESKGFRIYWPGKRSITVERNVVFNQNDTHTAENFAIIPGDALVEGEKDERDKVIQRPSNNVEDVKELEEPEDQDQNDIKTTQKHEITP